MAYKASQIGWQNQIPYIYLIYLTSKTVFMQKFTLIVVFLLIWMFSAFAQVSINTDASPPDNSAMLDV